MGNACALSITWNNTISSNGTHGYSSQHSLYQKEENTVNNTENTLLAKLKITNMISILFKMCSLGVYFFMKNKIGSI